MITTAGMNKHRSRYEYWLPVFSTDLGGNEVITYVFAENRMGTVVPKGAGSLNLISNEQMPIDAEVRRLTDTNGEALFKVNGVEYAFFVTTVEPVLDVHGRFLEWKHSLKRGS